ncbi:MAG TPA: hypothetical protein VFG10_16010 [Saprospiraceae bacterium]|nr:hypothetical protein [Saprospiraceae bacterium]
MKFQFLLWCNALVFAAYFAGHLFDLFIIIPNWSSGSIEEITLFNNFFHKTNPIDFYKVIMPFSTGLSVLCFIAFIRKGNPILVFLAICLFMDILIDVVTLHYFTPIHQYLFNDQAGNLDTQRVQKYVSTWMTADYMRLAFISIGFYASLGALHFSYAKR